MGRALPDDCTHVDMTGLDHSVAAISAPRPRKAMREDAALQSDETPLNVLMYRHLVVALAALGEPGIKVLLNAAIEHGSGSIDAADTASVRCPWLGTRFPMAAPCAPRRGGET